MKTRILPTVGEKYISRNDDVVVEVFDIRHLPELGDTDIWFKDQTHEYRYNLNAFWEYYKVMEASDD